MAKIKFTKTALKKERDALKQFRRFLPTLQLKKQQLQMEIMGSRKRLEENEAKEAQLKAQLDSWIELLGTPGAGDFLAGLIEIADVKTGVRNIAGVAVPIFDHLTYKPIPWDLFLTDPWIDLALENLKEVLAIRLEHRIIEEQYRLLSLELRTTTQRVNLFEKVKIPEARENIRKIQIYMGDMDTAGVARSKIAKKKTQEVAA